MIVSFGLLDDLPPTSDEAVLSWSPNPAAASYTVVLYDAQLTPIWESEPLTSPTVTLPREVRDGIVAEVVYFWRVISIVGGERLQSPVHRFTVER